MAGYGVAMDVESLVGPGLRSFIRQGRFITGVGSELGGLGVTFSVEKVRNFWSVIGESLDSE